MEVFFMSETLDRAALKGSARELLKTAVVCPKRMTALYCGLTLLLNIAEFLLDSFVPATADAASMLNLFSMFVSIFTTLAGFILAAGFTIYCMGIRQREEMGYGSLFDGFSFTGKIILLNIVMDAFVFLWSMLFAIPGIIAFYRYRFALYNLYENPGLNILEALEMSKRQTRGLKLSLFKLDLSYLGWALLSILPAIIVDSRAYLQAFSDPASLLAGSGASLVEILVCGVWSLVVSLFYLPNYQCVLLDYFDAAKAAVPDSRPFSRQDGPDDL